MFPTSWDYKEILNVVYVSVVCNFAARKHHHWCSVKVTMLVLLYVAVIVCKCCVYVLFYVMLLLVNIPTAVV